MSFGQIAYEAYRNKVFEVVNPALPFPTWDELSTNYQAIWHEVASKVIESTKEQNGSSERARGAGE